jgi:hypothetical protein
MKYLLIFMTLLFFVNIEPAFAGSEVPNAPQKNTFSQVSSVSASPSPQKEFLLEIIQKFVKNSRGLMLISGILSIFGVLGVLIVGKLMSPYVDLPIWLLLLGIGFLIGVASIILGAIGMKKATEEQNKHKTWGKVGVFTGASLALLSLIAFLLIALVIALIGIFY